MRYYINIGNWIEYIPDASTELPSNDRQTYAWALTQTGTAPIAVIASTSNSTPNANCLDIQASTSGTDNAYFGHSSGTTPFFTGINNARGYTIEAQVKNINSAAAGGQVIYWADNLKRDHLIFFETYVKFGYGGLTYPLNTTDDFHKYRITAVGTDLKLYIDNILRISGSLSATNTGALDSKLFFGDYYATYGGRCQWGYVKYNTDGVYPPNENVKDGWLFDNIDILDKRRLTETQVVRSHNTIINEGKMQAVKVKLSGTIAGSDYSSFRDTVGRLKRLLYKGTQRIYIDDERYIEGINSGFSLNPETQNYAKFSTDLVCRYPFWQESWASYFSTSPVSSATFYVVNNGDIEVPLRIIITGSAAGTVNNNLYLENLTAIQQCRFTALLSATQELFIDKGFETFNTYKVLVGTAQSYGSYEGDLFTLKPGENAFVYVGAALGTIEFYWREAYLQ